ncbi:MAG: glycosyltransferase [Rhodospirillaceae bacterium]|nr:glycosyltransferase [Rhodospirillales bacterium]
MAHLSSPTTTKRAARILEWAERIAPVRASWREKASGFYEEDYKYMRFLVPEGRRVLELGCGDGALLRALKPAHGVGVDFSPAMVDLAKEGAPEFEFILGDISNPATYESIEGEFDFIILSDTIGFLDDCEETLRLIHRIATRETRIIISYYSRFWEPILKTAEMAGLRMKQVDQNWLSTGEIENLLELADFEVIKREWRQLIPAKLFGLGSLINRFLVPIPMLRRACLRNYVVARPSLDCALDNPSVTVLVPCRNERGNVEEIVKRIPRFCDDIEILFVEGHSQDGTLDEINRVIAAYPEYDIKALVQDGKGKGDAVRKGFNAARGDLLMILDADMTMPPEALPKFYRALVSGKGEFINGSRLVYPMEEEAMRFLNHLANVAFSVLFTWLLNQRFTDTLCGTKCLSRHHYQRIANDRAYFGDFDPFGDFDLIFGASKANLKVIEIPIRYAARTYGTTQISRFRHGWLLLKMVVVAFRRLKAF